MSTELGEIAEEARTSRNNARLAKAQLTYHERLLQTDAARKYIKKAQLSRGGMGSGDWYRLRARSYDGKGPGELVKADGYIRTIYDLVEYHYGFVPEFLGGRAASKGISKDDPVLSSTTGVANTVFGSEVNSLLNSESNAYSLLEKRPWQRSGERAVNARGQTLGGGGVAENASLPATEKPDFITYEQSPKNVAHTFDVSQIEQLLAGTDDDHFADDPFDWLRRWYGTGTEHQTGQGEHPKHLNVQILEDVDTPKTNEYESIDRAISDSDESAITSAATDPDIYGFDRSANEFESNVDENSGTDRNFTIDILDDLIRLIREASGKDPVTDDRYFFLTGHDTYQRIENEVGGKERLEAVRTTVGLNGVQTVPGDDVGITVRAYKDIPIFRSNDIVSDTISRVYLIDPTTLWIKQLLPTQFYSTGIDIDENPFALDRLGNEGMFLTVGELTLTNPKAQAKARDLK